MTHKIKVEVKGITWIIHLLSCFQFLVFADRLCSPTFHVFPSASLSSYININSYSIFSLNMCSRTPDIAFNTPTYISYPYHVYFILFCLSSSLPSCLPSLRELSNNRSLDNLDCIGGTGSSLPPWDDDDFSQACSTLGRRSCLAQVSAFLDRTGRDCVKRAVWWDFTGQVMNSSFSPTVCISFSLISSADIFLMS